MLRERCSCACQFHQQNYVCIAWCHSILVYVPMPSQPSNSLSALKVLNFALGFVMKWIKLLTCVPFSQFFISNDMQQINEWTTFESTCNNYVSCQFSWFRTILKNSVEVKISIFFVNIFTVNSQASKINGPKFIIFFYKNHKLYKTLNENPKVSFQILIQ